MINYYFKIYLMHETPSDSSNFIVGVSFPVLTLILAVLLINISIIQYVKQKYKKLLKELYEKYILYDDNMTKLKLFKYFLCIENLFLIPRQFLLI